MYLFSQLVFTVSQASKIICNLPHILCNREICSKDSLKTDPHHSAVNIQSFSSNISSKFYFINKWINDNRILGNPSLEVTIKGGLVELRRIRESDDGTRGQKSRLSSHMEEICEENPGLRKSLPANPTTLCITLAYTYCMADQRTALLFFIYCNDSKRLTNDCDNNL